MAENRAPDGLIRLLYVEDEELTRTTICSFLARRFPELEIHSAPNGMKGLQLFRELSPDLVVTDIKMPEMDGIQMAKRIMELKPQIHIIVTSAHSDTAYLIECIENGISRYVMKPIDSGKLFQAVESCLVSLRLERELQAQQAFVRKLSRAVEQSPSGVVIADPQGVIEYVNPKFTKLTGYSELDVLGKNLQSLQESGEESWAAVAAGFDWQGELESVKKDGEPYSESVSLSPVFDEQGRVSHLVAVKQDITERKQSAREIEQLNLRLSARASELETANRDLEGFSYTVSHDLRSPLSTINGYCQVIQELYGAGMDEQCKQFLDIIIKETIAMGALISTLLDFSMVTRSALNRRSVDLSGMAEMIAAGVRMREPQRSFDFRIEPGIAADGDPDLLRVVMENLLGNAAKYTGAKDRALIEFGVTGSGREAVYFVRDNGAGFDMAQGGKLFNAFQRLHDDSEFQGFGIGLATVQRIVQRHGGQVRAEGEVDKGATFYFSLPPAAGRQH
jgi:PAS domain S-box-containing protein